MQRSKCVQTLLLLFPLAWLAGCGGGSAGASLQGQSASVFTMATDSPTVPSVVSAQFTISSVTLTGSGGSTPNLLSQSAVIDFAKLSGLHELEDLNAVPLGTYSSATIMLSAPVVQYIDVTQNPPVVNTLANAQLTQTTINVPLTKSFTLNANDLVGFRMEMELGKSLVTDGSGNLTGAINPTFKAQLLDATDANVSIDCFRAGYVGAINNNSFQVQGPHGRTWTVSVDSNTVYDTPGTMGSFNTNTIVEVSGQLDPVTKSIDATEIAALSTDKFVLGGLFTSIRPASPAPATAADLYVRYELPDVGGIQPGQITTLALNGSETYKIAHVQLPSFLTNLIFSNTLLAAGQRVAVGGALSTTTPPTLTVHRVVLEPQGQAGTWITGTTVISGSDNKTGSFKLNDNSTAGILLPNPLTVYTTAGTRFFGGITGLSDLSGTNPISLRIVGLILVSSSNSNQAVFVARSVEELSN